MTQAASDKPAPEYVLGTHAEELQRLGLQHELWSDAAHRLWRQANLQPGQRVLDVGCGPGYAARDMARIVGETGLVLGVDESPNYIDFFEDAARIAQMPWVHAVRADVHDIADSGRAHAPFDLAYARWVFCFLPDPARVLAGVASLMKPGAKLVIQDYFNYRSMTLAPREPTFETIVQAIDRSWSDNGGDTDVAGHLPRLLDEAGFDLEHLDVELRVARPGEFMWTWPNSFWKVFVPMLVDSGHLQQAQADAFFSAWDRACADPNTFFHLPPVYEFIAVKR